MLTVVADVAFAPSLIGGVGGVSSDVPEEQSIDFSELIDDLPDTVLEEDLAAGVVIDYEQVASMMPAMLPREPTSPTVSTGLPDLKPLASSDPKAKDSEQGEAEVIFRHAGARDKAHGDPVVQGEDGVSSNPVQTIDLMLSAKTGSAPPLAAGFPDRDGTDQRRVERLASSLQEAAQLDGRYTVSEKITPANAPSVGFDFTMPDPLDVAIRMVPDRGMNTLHSPSNAGDVTSLAGAERHVLQQIVAGASQAQGHVELTLTPEELGRVKMMMSSAEGTLQVMIQADRPETLDLIRRHADALDREFRVAGFGDIQFSFSGGNRDDNPQGFTHSISDSDVEGPDFAVIHHPSVTLSDAGLDLKL